MTAPIDWQNDVALGDLPDDLRELAEAVAGAATPLEAAERLVEGWGGSSLYVPALRDLRRVSLARQARRLLAEPGATEGAVRRRLGLSRRTLRVLLALDDDGPGARA